MNDISQHWHSTNDPNGPSPDAVSGTFRDIDLSMFETAWIDRIDAICQELEINRSELLQRAVQVVTSNKNLLTDPQAQLPAKVIGLDEIN